MVGVAVKLMDEPAQRLGLEAAMETDGTTVGITMAVMVFEFTVAGNAQVAFEFRITETASAFAKVDDENTEPLPAFTPFTSHW